MAAVSKPHENDNDENDEDIDYSTNLLELGPDAWDDSALIEAFNRDLQFYKKSHSNQLIDLSKVSNMINFKKAKKLTISAIVCPIMYPCTIPYDNDNNIYRINENITNHDPEETGYEDQDEEDDESEYEDEDEDEEESKENDIILEPSFMPFANVNRNTNKNNNQNKSMEQQNRNRINKYSSWPPQQNQIHSYSHSQSQSQNDHNSNTKRKKKKQKHKKHKQNMNENMNHIDTENLAQLYELQQQQQQAKQSTTNDQPRPHIARQPYSQEYQYQYQQHPQNHYYNPYYHQPPYYYPQRPQRPQQPPAMPQMPAMPPMPPYARSAMFNMGLNMMGPPAMSNKPTRDEALANMLLAWYWNGYYSGYQAAMENRK